MSAESNGNRAELPRGWEWKALGQIVRTSSGGTPSRKRPDFYEGGSIPWLKIGDLNDGLVQATQECITEEALRESSARKLPEGTLLIAMYGSIGKLGVLGVEAATNQAICALETENETLRDFLYWYLRGQRASLLAAGFGGTQANISQTYLKQLPVPLAPPAEQERLVNSVRTHIDSINAGEQEIERAGRAAHTYRAACLHAAFDGHRNGGAGFSSESLEAVAEIQSGLAKGRPTDDAALELPYIRTANVQAGYLDLEEIKTIVVSEKQRARHHLQSDDVLVLEGGDADKVGRGWIWEAQIGECLHQNHVFAVRPNGDRLLPRFLAYYINAPAAREYFLSVAKQTTNLASINKGNLRGLPLPLPEFSLQQEIVATLDQQMASVDALIGDIERRHNDVARLRSSVFASAFTGRSGPARSDG